MDEEPLDAAGRVAAAAAHSFNNHIAAISLQAELALAAGAGDDGVQRRLRMILDACADARVLARDLLAFGGRRVLSSERVDLVGAVRAAAGATTVDAGAEPLFVEADPAVLRDALAEVVALAVGADPVSVRAERDLAVVRVKTGSAGSGDGPLRLFEPFARDERPLALAGVYGFVRQSGGSVAIERDGDATVVALCLPRVTA